MKLVDVCAFYSPHGGGVKTYVEQKLQLGPQLGADITILAPGDEHAVTEFGPRARIITLPSPRLSVDRNYWYFGDRPALHAALDSLGPDLVEVSSPWRSPSWVAQWRGDVPRSLVMHADPMSAYAYRWLGSRLARPRIDLLFTPFWRHMQRLGEQYDSVICANRELTKRLAAGGVAHTRLEPMGVEEGVFAPGHRDPALRAQLLAQCGLPASTGLLLGVGRMAAEKRWPMVIEAVRLARQHRPLALVLLGAGGQAATVRAAIGNDPQIKLLEPVRERTRVAAIMASADALVHGCEAETFCLAAAEARASGVPVVVPDRGGAADHAAQGGGLTYRAADPADMAAAIGQLGQQGWLRTHAPVQTMRGHFELLFAHYRDLIAVRRT